MSPPLPRPVVAAVLALALFTAGCSGSEPDARVMDPERSSSSSTEEPTTTGSPPDGTAPPVAGDPLGPDDPAAHASLSAWEPCRGGFECATLTVPRDWAAVDGATLDLAVIRQPADGDPIGSLVFNPGGPGASGIEFLTSFVDGSLPDGLAERFDLVAWDPRGTGGSARIDCTSDADWLDEDVDPTPEDQADVDAIRAEAEGARAACAEAAGDLVDLVGTRATVRDLDALRGALGDEGLSFVGYSYGTTIGMEYLRLYPERVRAMVLDGVSVPGVDPVTDTHVQAQGFERTLDAYLDGCAARTTCRLGDDPKQALLDLVAALEAERIPASYTLESSGAEPRRGTLGVGELYIAVASALYSESAWPTLDRGLAEAMTDEPAGVTLLSLRDRYLGRQADGSWQDDADSRGAIRCADQADRVAEPEGDLALAATWGEELPFWGAWFASGVPGCWGAAPAIEPLAALGDGDLAGLPPVVVVGTTNDPATPYEQSEDAQRIIAGSVLVTYEGEEHTAYKSISDCVDDAVTAYLVDGTVPPAGLRCTG